MSTTMDSRWVIARKPHRCEDCSRTIPKGERYHHWKGIDDDGWRTFNTCAQCHECASDLWEIDVRGEDENGDDCYPYLPEVDWPDVAQMSPVWARRAAVYLVQWAGQPYPADEATS